MSEPLCYICRNCGKGWTAHPALAPLRVCPNCGADLEAEPLHPTSTRMPAQPGTPPGVEALAKLTEPERVALLSALLRSMPDPIVRHRVLMLSTDDALRQLSDTGREEFERAERLDAELKALKADNTRLRVRLAAAIRPDCRHCTNGLVSHEVHPSGDCQICRGSGEGPPIDPESL